MNRGRPRNAGGGYSNARGRSTRSNDTFAYRHSQGKGYETSNDDSLGTSGGRSWQHMSLGPHYEPKRPSDSANQQMWSSRGRSKAFSKRFFDDQNANQQGENSTDVMSSRSTSEQSMSSLVSHLVHEQDFSSSPAQSDLKGLRSGLDRTHIGQTPGEVTSDVSTLLNDLSNKLGASQLGETQSPPKSSVKDEESKMKKRTDNTEDSKNSEDCKHSSGIEAFDICPLKARAGVKLKPPLLMKNREMRNEMKRSVEGQNGRVLRPGMVLLKNFLSLSDQVKVLKKCRDLGVGSGGFYQPGYRDGAILHLKMMCLGKNWDPETSKYGELRPIDNAKPPSIPVEFCHLVAKAMKDSYTHTEKEFKTKNPEVIIPWMSPDICIVNFYSTNGRLGLHQDRDESQESLEKCRPVVSFSVGDSADFLYGDQRDVDKAEKVVLDSGDVLIFGGKSRHIFHGVTAVHQNTAPKALLEETNFRAGRLNLTFRQY